MWDHAPKYVKLTHYKDGPSFTIECRAFDTESLDETSIFWKAKEGWRAIRTTAFGLEDPVADMNDYVSRCAAFDLQGSTREEGGIKSPGYVGQMLGAVGPRLQVREARIYKLAELQTDVSRMKSSS